MVSAVAGRLFVASMNDQPVPPILFFPTFLQSGKRKDLPVRLTDITIDQKVLHVSFVPLTADERAELTASVAAAADQQAPAPTPP